MLGPKVSGLPGPPESTPMQSSEGWTIMYSFGEGRPMGPTPDANNAVNRISTLAGTLRATGFVRLRIAQGTSALDGIFKRCAHPVRAASGGNVAARDESPAGK